jgi:hypothetical protein
MEVIPSAYFLLLLLSHNIDFNEALVLLLLLPLIN